MSPSFRPGIQLILLRNMPSSSLLIPTGLSPSMALLSRKFQIIQLRLKVSLTTPHVPYISVRNSVCSVPCSLADNNGISIDFFSSRYLDVSFP